MENNFDEMLSDPNKDDGLESKKSGYDAEKLMDKYLPNVDVENVEIDVEPEAPIQEFYDVDVESGSTILNTEDQEEEKEKIVENIPQQELPQREDFNSKAEYEQALKQLEYERQRAQQLEATLYQTENQYMNNINVLQNELAQKNLQEAQNYEKALLSEEKRIKNALYLAKEEGDTKAEIGLFDALAEIKSKKEALKIYNQNLQQPIQQQIPVQNSYQPIVEPIYQQNMQPSESEKVFNEWVSKNSWYNFDENLRKEADELGAEFAKVLHMSDASKYVGTKAFYDTISDELQKKYGMKKESASSSSKYNVAPASTYSNPTVNTKGPKTMAERYNQQNPGKQKTVKLNRWEYQVAINTTPRDNPNMSQAERVKRWVKAYDPPKDPRYLDDDISIKIPV